MRQRSANEWREFWATRGESELAALLDEFAPYMTRVATLLGSRAPQPALAAELTRIREHELAAPPDSERDNEVAQRIHDWLESA